MTQLEQLFKKGLVTSFGPQKMLPELKFAEMEPGWDCGGGTYTITREEVEKFSALMGDPNRGAVNVPVGMIYIFGLRICWAVRYSLIRRYVPATGSPSTNPPSSATPSPPSFPSPTRRN